MCCCPEQLNYDDGEWKRCAEAVGWSGAATAALALILAQAA